MIGGGAIARRYAHALFGLGEEVADAGTLLADLEAFTQVVEASDELSRVMFTPLYPRAERRAVAWQTTGAPMAHEPSHTLGHPALCA